LRRNKNKSLSKNKKPNANVNPVNSFPYLAGFAVAG